MNGWDMRYETKQLSYATISTNGYKSFAKSAWARSGGAPYRFFSDGTKDFVEIDKRTKHMYTQNPL